jgi:hypothetical protein
VSCRVDREHPWTAASWGSLLGWDRQMQKPAPTWRRADPEDAKSAGMPEQQPQLTVWQAAAAAAAAQGISAR